jgi:hypothetical protein
MARADIAVIDGGDSLRAYLRSLRGWLGFVIPARRDSVWFGVPSLLPLFVSAEVCLVQAI